jgi:SAM domain (Sterile alpha motif)
MDVATWLEALGLGQYAPAFVENDLDLTLLSAHSEADLRELGVVSLGHRKRLLAAIAERVAVAPGASARPPCRTTANGAKSPSSSLISVASPRHSRR